MIYACYSIILIILIYLSSFFSKSETAYLSLNKIILRQAVDGKKKHAKLINRMYNKRDRLLSAILVGNNFVNTLASSVATAFAVDLLGRGGTGVAAAMMTIFIVVFGEILPKTVASIYPYEIACKTAVFLSFFDYIMIPITFIFEFIIKNINKFISLLSGGKKQQLITEEELKTLIDTGNLEGTLGTNEKHILHNIVEFSDLRVRDICKPKALVAAVSDENDYDHILEVFSRFGYSKLPVYHESMDNIVGVLHFKDLFNYKSFNLKKQVRPVCYVPETITALNVLRYFKKEKQNIAIVVDEHGSNCGLITMDDILRSILGVTMRIFDDAEDNPLNRVEVLNTNQFIVPGEIRISDFNQAFLMNLKSEEFDTLGGWILEQFGTLPSTGEAIKRQNAIFYIEDQGQRRIKSVRVTLV
ncbi:MAG: CNNM domain-containing protein [Treponemataceae bacterium]